MTKKEEDEVHEGVGESIGEDIFSGFQGISSGSIKASLFSSLSLLRLFLDFRTALAVLVMSSLEAQDSPQFVVIKELRGSRERNNQKREESFLRERRIYPKE